MGEVYIIKRARRNGSSHCWEGIETLLIDKYPWDKSGYRPRTEVKLCVADASFKLFFRAYEQKLRAEVLSMNGPTHTDSCVEFFLRPKSCDPRYINFEINPLGVVFSGLGENRGNRVTIDMTNTHRLFHIRTSVTKEALKSYNGGCWTVEYSVPFEFLEACFGKLDFKSGEELAGNFYKCGDKAEQPHFGCWSEVVSELPDFHRPESFGRLILE